MGLMNRFMPSEELTVLEGFEGGLILWVYGEDQTTSRSCLTIYFVRNITMIQNHHFKNYAQQLMDKVKEHMNVDKAFEVTNLSGVYAYIEFEDPNYTELVKYVEEAKQKFKKE